MALFTDGPPNNLEELAAEDSQLLSVATSEGIDVTQKLRLAHEEVGMDLYTLLTRTRSADQLFGSSIRPNLEKVAVTPPLKLWHACHALEMVYADAYNSQLNDRYAGKRDQYRQRARWAYEKLMQNGLGIVEAPVPKPATPVVTAAAGAVPDGTYFVTMTWVNRAGETGAAAEPATIATTASAFLVQPAAESGGGPPQNATGWNVYVGTAPDSMVQQNPAALAPGTSWLQADNLLTAGRNPGAGQKPSVLQPIPRIIQRG